MKSKISEISISQTSRLRDAMSMMDSSAIQIALVVDSHNRLIATLTDGDIRRALLSGATLESEVFPFMNKSFRSASIDESSVLILSRMKSEDVRHIPVLDDNGVVVDLLSLQDLLRPTSHTNPVVIMAGGKGTRLKPYTNNCPKPMIKVDGKPMLEILLEHCIECGFREFYFSVNYLKEQIIDYFEDGQNWGVRINYLVEDTPLGSRIASVTTTLC